jgi:hypothetical protein
MLLLPGCLYVAPVWRKPVDLPPEILLPSVSPGDTIELTFVSAQESITVVAQDPEGEPLAFVWQIPAGVVATPNTFEDNGVTSSNIVLPADPVLDETTLALAIFDPGGNDADIRWHLVIP